MRHVFIDCEWTLDQEIFLIAYAFRMGRSGSIYGKDLNRKYVAHLLRQVHYIYVYGPDIAYLEKNFPIDFRNQFKCINMLRLVRMLIPGLPSYSLQSMEQHFGLHRSTRKYKTSVFTIWQHWADRVKRRHVIRYNLEDARNLRSLYEILIEQYQPPQSLILDCQLL